MIGLHLHHIHAHRFDDLLATNGRAQAHRKRTENDEPERKGHVRGIHATHSQHDTEHADREEFLAILRTVHDSHACSGEHLRDAPFVLEASAICLLEELLKQLGEQPTTTETATGRNDEAIDDLHPLSAINTS